MLFVALCRTAGIAARIDHTRALPQYWNDVAWQDVNFESVLPPAQTTAVLRLSVDADFSSEIPVYGTQYTIARFENGRYRTLDYGNDQRVQSMPILLTVQSGEYMLVSGRRRNDGSVSGAMDFFSVTDKDSTDRVIRFERQDEEYPPLGIIADQLLPPSESDYNVLLWFQPGSEPTTHILNDISAVKDGFLAANISLLYTGKDGYLSRDIQKYYAEILPESSRYIRDDELTLLHSLIDVVQKDQHIDFPAVAVMDAYGTVYFFYYGYSVGIGRRLPGILTTLQKNSPENP